MGRYVSFDDVKVRVGGKIRFTEDPDENENLMPITLANRLISEAESQVEQDLSTRYSAPFEAVSADGTFTVSAFKNLPQETKDTIKTLCELQAVIRLLETDFGSAGPVDSSKYIDRLEKRYEKRVEKLVEVRDGTSNTFVYPPMPNLRLNYQNEEADTGFKGRVLTYSGSNDGGFPDTRINDPSEDFFSHDGT